MSSEEYANSQLKELDLAYDGDKDKYAKNSFGGKYGYYTKNQLAGHIMLNAHSLEKGLSSENFELGHGFDKIEELARLLNTYKNKGFNLSHPAFKTGVAAIKVYNDIYADSDYKEAFSKLVAEINRDDLRQFEKDIYGTKTVSLISKKNNDKKNFSDLAMGRSSVREFSGAKIKEEDLIEAVEIAQKSPSACNRQSSRIHKIHDKDIVREVMLIQDGFAYEIPPEYIFLITVDDSNFSGAGERNQGYIDGGMFVMSLLYALEYKKIAACPLHASFTFEKETLFRQILNIPDREKLIAFIAIGSFKDNFVVAKSYRYPVTYIMSDITKLAPPTPTNAENIESAEDCVPKIKDKEMISELRKRIRIRTRLKNVRNAKQQGKIFFQIYNKLAFLTRSRKSKVYIFGAPFHSNLGDQAQTYCMEEWYRKKLPNHNVLSIDTVSAQKMDNYIIRKIRDTIRSGDKIVLHSGYHTTDIWEMENNLNIRIIETFPDFPIMVFPQTINFKDKNKLKDTASVYREHGDVTLMCRDEESYQTAKENFKGVNILLMPDIVTTLIGDDSFVSPASDKKREGISMCFRNDKESKYGAEVGSMIESIRGLTDRIDKTDTTIDTDWGYIAANRSKVLKKFMKGLGGYKLVITDRYHGTIFSAITGTPVIVLGSTDHKLSSGVKWFSDKFFSDAVFYAGSPAEAVELAHKIYGKYDYGKSIPEVFNIKYWDKLEVKSSEN